MSHSDEQSVPTRRWQLGLGTLLALILVLAIGLGWWTDRSRLADELATARLETEMQQRQISKFKDELHVSPSGDIKDRINTDGDFNSTWTPATFVKTLEGEDPGYGFHQMQMDLGKADDVDFDATIERLIPLVQSANLRLRTNALEVLEGEFVVYPERMKPHKAKLTEALLPMLNQAEYGEQVVDDALSILMVMGTNPSKDAIAKVKEIMEDDNHPCVLRAVFAAEQMDSSISIVARLKELIETRHSCWKDAVQCFPYHVPEEEGNAFLKQQYSEVTTDQERALFIEALNETGRFQ